MKLRTLVALFLITALVCCAPNSVVPLTSSTVASAESLATSTEAIAEWIDGAVGKDDTITSITLEDRVLEIGVMLGDLGIFQDMPEELAASRASSITDDLLDHTELDDEWDTITILFDGIGRFTFTKDDIQENEYNMRFFDAYNEDGTPRIEAE